MKIRHAYGCLTEGFLANTAQLDPPDGRRLDQDPGLRSKAQSEQRLRHLPHLLSIFEWPTWLRHAQRESWHEAYLSVSEDTPFVRQ